MAQGIMIMGPSGSGKTSLGALVAQALGFTFIDIDDYIWRKDTPIPFSAMYPRAEKISRLMEAVENCEHFVMAGSMDSFHEHFDPFFALVVHLYADAHTRQQRVHERELQEFGARVLEGGDMHKAHEQYLHDVAGYDADFGGCTLRDHEKWLSSLSCPILRLDGTQPLDENLQRITSVYSAI